MAPSKPKKQAPRLAKKCPETTSSTFVVLKFADRKDSLLSFRSSTIQEHHLDSASQTAKQTPSYTIQCTPLLLAADMQTRRAWGRNLANPNNQRHDPPTPHTSRPLSTSKRAQVARTVGSPATPSRIAKPKIGPVRRQPISIPKIKVEDEDEFDEVYHHVANYSDDSLEASDEEERDKDIEMAERPKLKLKLGTGVGSLSGQPPSATPQTASRPTPTIRLSVGGINRPEELKNLKKEEVDGTAPGSSAKKRKHSKIDPDDNTPVRPAQARKLTFVTKQAAQTPGPAVLKLKAKGKIPKRPLGVGYDSELEDREVDPVILEGFILRMQPGPDCDYLRNAIETGQIGDNRPPGGVNVRLRVLDTLGRRGLLMIRSNQYATTLVDLPCIIEGMKSWDKKGFIKSLDISQMMIVLGPCKSDEEARNYPLPEDVNPHNYQYAHGLTAPMKWVRKRRFARTRRTRVDDIEAVERRVNALLEADAQAQSASYEVLDYDPRSHQPQYSPVDSDDEDADADAEGEEDEEPLDYFGRTNGNAIVQTPYTATPEEDIGQDDVDEFARMFEDDDAPASGATSQPISALQLPDGGDSSFAVTSTSASPSATAAPTPASVLEPSSDEDGDDDDEEERDDEEKDEDENLNQIKGRIQDVEDKIREQREVLRQTQNGILRRKIAKRIEDLQDDVKMMKTTAGISTGGGDDDDE